MSGSQPATRNPLQDLKRRIRDAQLRTAFAVSRELVSLPVDWPEILERQRAPGWGAKVIERLSHDLQIEFSGVEGYSLRNLKYMRTLAEVWPDPEKVPQLVALCRGATSGFFSISSKTLRCGNGISGRRSNTAGAAMSCFSG